MTSGGHKREVSVAGKSPDRSEQQMSSGETTGKAETVPERARDPRVALQEPPRDAEAAGGSGKPSPDGGAPEEAAEEASGEPEKADGRAGAEAGDGSRADEAPGEQDADETAGADDSDDSDEVEEGAGGASGTEAPADDVTEAGKPDAGKPGTGDEQEKAEPGPERPVDRTTAFLRVPEGEAERAAKAPEDGEGPEGPEDTEPAEDARDTEDARDGGGKDEKPEPATEPEPEAESKSEAESGPQRPVDQTTAIFRVPRSRKEDAESGDAGKAGKDKPGAGEAEDGEPVDQPTAMFRAVRPAPAAEPSDEAAGTGEAEADRTGETKTGGVKADRTAEADEDAKSGGTAKAAAAGASAVSSEEDAAGKEDGAGKPGEAAAERTSRFVPLRSPDAPGAPGASERQPVSDLPETERTKQQPLPPHMPLELLAELTNKPAPPPTPLRVALRRIKIWSPLVVLLAIILSIVQLVRPLPEPELVLTVPATHSFEGDKPSLAWPPEGQAVVEVEGLGSLGSYGEQKPVPIASVAKTMTAYIVLRDHPLKKGEEGPRIPVDRQAEEDAGLSSEGESTVEVKEGEKITLREALNALMIASANNVARLLARWDAGSEKAFVKKMNDTAKELGMTDTTYTDASGLREDTVSTAADQVKLGKKVMDFEVFREVVKLPKYIDRNGTEHRNWNGLVPFNGAVGIKTGTTTAAGGNLLFAAEKEIGGTTQLIVGAVFGQHKPSIIDTVIAETRELMISAQEVLESEKIIKKGDVVGYVDDGLGGRTPLVATEDVTAIGWPGVETELALTDGGKGVPHEAAAGETVGTLTVGSGPGQVKVPVAVQEELTEPGVGAKLTRVL
ncbi:D-alanyl-D-alanine carboxypeptidase [Streptomyces glaucosporus]|uniref:D-alanyl-D-alanine carboxypeptidase n=1 Tax=Streptomyces glaucosporus TaxID=284044 RepID=A0ABN3HRB0_9ACTN